MPKFLDKDAGIPLLISLEMILGECFFLSLYKSASLSVSESVWMFPNSSETANPSKLKF